MANESAVIQIVTDNGASVYNSASESPSWFCFAQITSDCDANSMIRTGEWYAGSYTSSGSRQLQVQYCLAESIQPHCKVTFNVFMLLIAVICNAVKAAAFILLLLLPGFKPLITIGDAIASFLTYPDQVTARHGAPAIAGDGSWTPPILSTPWRPQRCHWFCGATLRQWIVGTIS